jgi:hypothetical protein
LDKPYNVSLEAPEKVSAEAGDTLKRTGICYSLTGITSGIVKKRQVGKSGNTCGIFAKDWPEWLTVESAFDMDLAWVCVQEATFVANLAILYPKTTFMVWEPEFVLPPVNFIFCSHWLPPLINKIWQLPGWKFYWRHWKSFGLLKIGTGSVCQLKSNIVMWVVFLT